ncbi:hypothetical protein [Enterovibrio sp. 27052020O]
MLKAPGPQQYELEMVTLEQWVTKSHLVRQIDIDFESIHDEIESIPS